MPDIPWVMVTLLLAPLACVDQVRNRGRLCPDMERLGPLLKVLVRTRHSLMLAEMLCPGFNEKSFHEVSGARDILKEAPPEKRSGKVSHQGRDSSSKRAARGASASARARRQRRSCPMCISVFMFRPYSRPTPRTRDLIHDDAVHEMYAGVSGR